MGALDPDFATAGVRRDSLGVPATLQVQPDGRILTLHYLLSGSHHLNLLRLNTDGSRDASFTAGDIDSTVLGQYNSRFPTMVLQGDGKILLCAITDTGSNSYAAYVVRLNSDGSLDTQFGQHGTAKVKLGSLSGLGNIAVNNTSGSIAIAGNYFTQPFVIQFTADGRVDSTFGTNGTYMHATNNVGYTITALAYQPDGKILASGIYGSTTVGGARVFVLRLAADGTEDAGFGQGGETTTYGTSVAADRGYGMALQHDGKIVVAGSSHKGTVDRFLLVRFNADGTADAGFDSAGADVIYYSGHLCTGSGVAIDPEGRYVVSGAVSDSTGALYSVSMLRVNADGTVDSTFGTNGLTRTDLGGGSSQKSLAVGLCPNGRIVALAQVPAGSATLGYLSGLTIGISDLHTAATDALIYPNPLRTSETLRYTLGTDDKVSVSLYAMDGKMVQQFISEEARTAGAHTEALSLSPALPAGAYILRVSTTHGSCAIKVQKTE